MFHNIKNKLILFCLSIVFNNAHFVNKYHLFKILLAHPGFEPGLRDSESRVLTNYTKRVVLFLPEAEYHELGILYVHFLLKQNGIYVDYLGTNIPMADLEFLVSRTKPDYLFCHITSPAKKFKLDKFLEGLSKINKTSPVILSGQIVRDYKGQIASNISVKRSLAETIQFLNTI